MSQLLVITPVRGYRSGGTYAAFPPTSPGYHIWVTIANTKRDEMLHTSNVRTPAR